MFTAHSIASVIHGQSIFVTCQFNNVQE